MQSLEAVHAQARRVDDRVRPGAHLARAGWVQRGLAVLGHPVEILPGVSTDGPGEISPSLKGSNACWVRILLAQRTAFTHSRRSWSVER